MVTAAIFLAVAWLRALGTLETVELAAYDWLVRCQPALSTTNRDLVLIEITEADIRGLGQWPLTDETLARALEILAGARPGSIGIDLYRDIPVPPGTERLDRILSAAPNVIVVTKFGDGGVRAPPAVQDPDRIAFNDVLVDPDGTVRRGLLFLDDGENVYYSLSLDWRSAGCRRKGPVCRRTPSSPTTSGSAPPPCHPWSPMTVPL
jgi:adenylate cyclase